MDFTTAPQGRWVAWRALTAGRQSLFLLDLKNPVAHQAALVHTGRIVQYQFTPDGDSLVWQSSADAPDAAGLYTVRTAQPAKLQRLTPALPPGARIQDFSLAPDSHSLSYLANTNQYTQVAPYWVPLTEGTPSRRLGAPLIAGGQATSHAYSDDGQVLYRASAQARGQDELWLASALAPEQSQRINGALVPGGDVLDFLPIPRARVIYLATQSRPQQAELFLAALDAQTPAQRLNPPLPTGASVLSYRAAGEQLVYALAQDDGTALYAVALAQPGVAHRLTPAFAPAQRLGAFALSVDGGWAWYVLDDGQRMSLYAAATSGSQAPRRVTVLEHAAVWSIATAPQGTGLAYVADEANAAEQTRSGLWWLASPAGTPLRLNPPEQTVSPPLGFMP